MPWKRLCPKAKKAAIKHGKRRPNRNSPKMRCWSYKRSQLMRVHDLRFWHRVRFWLISDK